MGLGFKLKHHFFSAFRELFVHHHGSLEFRAKIFTLLISTNTEIKDECYSIVNNIGMQVYKGDTDRANLLTITTKELVKKVKDNNGLDIDTLIEHLQRELKIIPRYAKKIDIDLLKTLTDLSHDRDTISYQNNIIEFLTKLKEETLHTKKIQIESDEEDIESKY
ncbi:hypothetical protein N9A28_06080 [Sulfurimonas sp.]|nr:hypothetical protein [Sulfurimonas sp.]